MLSVKTEIQRPETGDLNSLFVYGIFLDKDKRASYGMSNPLYTTVKGFATVPLMGDMVAAVPLEGYNLTGLLVEVNPGDWWKIDRLESAYDRIKVNTYFGESWMYVRPYKYTRS